MARRHGEGNAALAGGVSPRRVVSPGQLRGGSGDEIAAAQVN